jgi:predicted TIM-barrel fold metal-dependent hydrolase
MGRQIGLRFRGQSFGGGSTCVCHSRRQVLAGLGAAAAATLLPAVARGQVASPAVRSIDVHHHIYPPRYQADNYQRFVENTGPGSAAVSASWSLSRAVEKMDQAGVAVAINSISSPGVWFDDGEAGRVRARECNEFGAQMIRDFPGRFGMFAAIPLPDTEGSLRELEHAFDVLKFDGVGLMTSYGGKLLGDPQFAPVFDEINRRKAVVFVHPTTSCCTNPIPGVSPIIIEFPMDTTRTILSLLMSGTFARCPDIRFIFAHGGGMLTSIANRIARATDAMTAEEKMVKLPKGPQYELERQFYDVASIGLSPAGMAGVRKLLPTSQLLFGSDEPFLSSAQLANSLQKLGFSADELQAVLRNNALRLFPRFQS